jgi:hypothetical protein
MNFRCIKNIHYKNYLYGILSFQFWSTLVYIHLIVSCCPNSPLTMIIFWSTINLCLEFWIGCNFINFIYKCCHMFHQTSISMPPTIKCIIKRTFKAIYLKSHFQTFFFFCFINCIELLLTSNWSKKPFNLWVEFWPWNRKIRIDVQW